MTTIINQISDVAELIKISNVHVFKFLLTGNPVSNRYPKICVSINKSIIYSGPVKDQQEIITDPIVFDHDLEIIINYFGKTDQDTKLIDNAIVENQHLKINEIWIDKLQLSKYQIADFGVTNYYLTNQQKKAYTSAGLHWKDIHTNTLWDNGFWKLSLRLPLMVEILRLQKQRYPRAVIDADHSSILQKLQNYFKK